MRLNNFFCVGVIRVSLQNFRGTDTLLLEVSVIKTMPRFLISCESAPEFVCIFF